MKITSFLLSASVFLSQNLVAANEPRVITHPCHSHFSFRTSGMGNKIEEKIILSEASRLLSQIAGLGQSHEFLEALYANYIEFVRNAKSSTNTMSELIAATALAMYDPDIKIDKDIVHAFMCRESQYADELINVNFLPMDPQ